MIYNVIFKYTTLKWLIALLIGCVSQQVGYTQGLTSSQPSIHFRDGAVIDVKRNEIYVSNSRAIVEALDLATGEKVWTTNIEGRPLFIKDEVLYVQVKKDRPTSELEIVGLSLSDKGEIVYRVFAMLPKSVTCYFKRSPSGTFHLIPHFVKSEIILKWVYRHRLNGEYVAEEEQQIEKGFLLFGREKFTKVKSTELPKNYNRNSIVPTQKSRIQVDNGQQFFSRDKKHILVSSFASKAGIEQNYNWKIYDRNSKKLIGQFKSNVSYAPFIVQKSTIIYERGAYQIFNNKRVKDYPLQLIWFDLNKRKLLNSIEILDDTYRGPTPP